MVKNGDILQILVTTMHQKDLTLAEKMNIQGKAILANQADGYGYLREGDIEMVTTPGRGTSKNRNIALACADSDVEYIMFSDDDLVFKDGYEQLILGEFEKHPEAEAIKFNLYNISQKRKISMRQIEKFSRATRLNITSSGVCGLVIRQRVLKTKNLKFNETFGSGTKDYCGEDSIFLQDLIKKGVRFYLSPVEVAGIDQSESSWFDGYTEKYFCVSGKILAAIYPRFSYLLAVRSAYRFSQRKNCKMKFWSILKQYFKGIWAYLHE